MRTMVNVGREDHIEAANRWRANPGWEWVRMLVMTTLALRRPANPLMLYVRSSYVHRQPSATPNNLLARVAERDSEAFAILYDELSSMVFGLTLRISKSRALAEEVTQEVFIQVWNQAARFDPTKGSVRSWVATIAHRRAVDVVRHTQASTNRDASIPAPGWSPDIADEIVEAEDQATVRRALEGLTDLQREAIELAYFGGLTYSEVATRLGAPLGTVKTRMRDGLAKIRSTLGEGL